MNKIFIIAIFIIAFIVTYKVTSDKKNAPILPNLSNTTITSSPSQDEGEKTKVIASNLEVPWALVFLPDNSILVTERAGKVKLVKSSGEVMTIANIPVKQTGESGLHGITIDPKFSENHFVYLYYTYSGVGEETLNKVSKFKFENNQLIDEQVIVDKIPGAIFHDGGRIKFGPDGLLYITTGDALNPSLSQDQNSLAGKILRVNGSKVDIFSLGHRNPQGITWDQDGNLWETEHGPSGIWPDCCQDEVNKISQGKNYGWPIIKGDSQKSGMETPIIHSGRDIWAPAGSAFFKDSIFFGALKGQALLQYNIQTKELKTHFKGEFGRIREVILGPDNMLYITTSNRDGRGSPKDSDDKIIRLDPKSLQ